LTDQVSRPLPPRVVLHDGRTAGPEEGAVVERVSPINAPCKPCASRDGVEFYAWPPHQLVQTVVQVGYDHSFRHDTSLDFQQLTDDIARGVGVFASREQIEAQMNAELGVQYDGGEDIEESS